MLHLNNEQLRAVRHVDGPMLVLAGPGSGKTAVLTQRVNYLISTANIKADSVLVLTFSNKAASEMQHRFNSIAGVKPVTFGTFHSVFFHVLKQYKNYGSDSIISSAHKTAIIRDIGIKFGVRENIDMRWCKETLERISAYQNTSLMPKYLTDDELQSFSLVFNEYKRRLKNEGLVDFDDMIYECLQLLKNNPCILNDIRDRYRYILVDEFQDCNTGQYELLKLIAKEKNNLFVVGDDDQSIYGFRGADAGIALKFIRDFPNCGYVELIRNYRCSQSIIDAAYSLIGHNHIRKMKSKQLASKFRGKGEVCLIKTLDAYSEAQKVYEIIENVLAQGIKPSEITILYRTDTASDYLQEYLQNKKINSNKSGTRGLGEKEYVKDISAYLRLSQGSKDSADFLRILNKPERGLVRECIGKDFADKEKILSYYSGDFCMIPVVEELFRDLFFISDLSSFAAINYIWKKVGYGRYSGYEQIPDEIKAHSDKHSSIKDFLSSLKPENSINEREKSNEDEEDRIILQTIHASKGLEYDTVIIIGLQEGLFPHNRARSEEETEEERRLMYVAMTRAINRLYIIARGKENHGKKYSRFIDELFN